MNFVTLQNVLPKDRGPAFVTEETVKCFLFKMGFVTAVQQHKNDCSVTAVLGKEDKLYGLKQPWG